MPALPLFKEKVLSFTINQILLILKCTSGKLSLVLPQEVAKSSAG